MNNLKISMSYYNLICEEMYSLANDAEAQYLMKFFKTGKGEYGEGDIFLGIRVPTTRSIVKKYRKNIKLEDVANLITSKYHEIRLAGFLLLVELYTQSKKHNDNVAMRRFVDFYISSLQYGNNWDLVDLVSGKLLGDWLVINPNERYILDRLSEMNNHIWHQRTAIVATLELIRSGQYEDTLRIAIQYINHSHDLIHKATGWMLREVGKRGGMKQLIDFLNQHAANMPRTMLRYAIEHFSPEQRKYYLDLRASINSGKLRRINPPILL